MGHKRTRVLVAALLVALTGCTGTGERPASPLVSMAGDDTPISATVRSQNQFGIDLYRELAQGNANNVFISPYSMANALAMLADGARANTASELGNVLHFPNTTYQPENADRIPWDVAEVYAGIQELNSQLRPNEGTPEEIATRAEVEKFRAQLEELRAEIQQLDRKPAEIEALQEAADRLLQENRNLVAERDKHSEGSDEYQEYASLISKNREQRGDLRKQQSDIRKKHYREVVAPLLGKELALVALINTRSESLGCDLRIANAIWAEQSQSFEQSYVEAVSEAFQTGGLRPADFLNQPEVERERINRWVEKQTNNRIRNLMPPRSIDETTAMVLTNAIYFRGDWNSPFHQRDTQPRDFTLVDGQVIQTPMMRQTGIENCKYGAFQSDGSFFDSPARYDPDDPPALYPGNDGFHMISLPYRGDDVSMVVVAPMAHNGLDRLEEMLSEVQLDQWISGLRQRETAVILPKFELRQSFDMQSVLEKLGLKDAFVPGGADFTGISNPDSPADRLFVSHIQHQTYLDVNERGTEAAAATGVGEAKSEERRMIDFIPDFRADRPFLFLIRHNETGSILFLGRLTSPQSAG